MRKIRIHRLCEVELIRSKLWSFYAYDFHCKCWYTTNKYWIAPFYLFPPQTRGPLRHHQTPHLQFHGIRFSPSSKNAKYIWTKKNCPESESWQNSFQRLSLRWISHFNCDIFEKDDNELKHGSVPKKAPFSASESISAYSYWYADGTKITLKIHFLYIINWRTTSKYVFLAVYKCDLALLKRLFKLFQKQI